MMEQVIFVFSTLDLPFLKGNEPEARGNSLTFVSIMEEGERRVGLGLV